MKEFKYIFLLFVVGILVSCGCGGSSGDGPEPPDSTSSIDNPVPEENPLPEEEDSNDDDEQLSLRSDVYMAIGCGITTGSGPTIGEPWTELMYVKGIHIRNLGTSGTHSSYGASRIDQNMNKYRPSLVLVLYGVNDISAGISTSTIIENLEQIIQVVEYYGGDIIVGTIPLVAKYSGSEVNAARTLNSRIKQMCDQYGIECADVAGRLGHEDSLYLDDDFHPTPEGQQFIASAFLSKIQN